MAQRTLIFDIEATDLEASFGHCLCIGYKWLGQRRTSVVSLRDFPHVKDPAKEPDIHLMKAFHKLIVNEADILISFYGKEFDWKFLNTRMTLAGLPPMPPFGSNHIDMYYITKMNLKLHSNRLQAVSETLGCPVSKTPVRADVWRRAQRGHKESLDYIIEHCKRDIEVLEWVYLKLRGFIRQHPWINGVQSCRNCGGTSFVQHKDRVVASGAIHHQIQCQDCGRYDTIKPSKEE